MSSRTHRKGFSTKLPKDGWHEDRDVPWESYKERCYCEGAHVKIYTYGECIEWLNDSGQLHREDGPAIENQNGYKEWYVNGQRHRLDGPAIVYANGSKVWYVNGRHHRLDGPAIERWDGTVWFYKDGFHYADITFTQRFY